VRRGSLAHASNIRYFAYGSNMGRTVMAALCPGNRCLGRAELPGHRLAFTRRSVRTGTGVADVLAAEGHSVWGVLYELDERMLAAIDAKEGNGWAYRRVQVLVRPDGREPLVAAQAYAVIAPEETEVRPSPEYLRALLEPARAHSLPEGYIAAIADRLA
jgi:gamma-glutamylcyclotransferase